jgi:translation initiation factor 1 (eIF-1/SUI1)
MNRMGKAALLDWATQACRLEHLTSEHAAALTKKELIAELLDVQLQHEVFAEQASGATGEQVVVVSSTETHVDGKTVTVVAGSDSWEEQRKTALAADRAARSDLPAWKRLRSGHACSLCGADADSAGSTALRCAGSTTDSGGRWSGWTA